MGLGSFLRMFLGPINVRASRKDVQLKVKEEYNSYRVYILFLPSFLDHLTCHVWLIHAIGNAMAVNVMVTLILHLLLDQFVEFTYVA